MAFPTKRIRRTSGGAAALLMAGALLLLTSHDANATPQFAKETGKSCATCHQNPEEGEKLTTFGTQFKANNDKLPTKNGKKSPSKSAPAKAVSTTTH